MALTRVLILLLVLFVGSTTFVWTVSSTPFFNRNRLKKIAKWTMIGTGALTLTVIAFALIFSFDHTA